MEISSQNNGVSIFTGCNDISYKLIYYSIFDIEHQIKGIDGDGPVAYSVAYSMLVMLKSKFTLNILYLKRINKTKTNIVKYVKTQHARSFIRLKMLNKFS